MSRIASLALVIALAVSSSLALHGAADQVSGTVVTSKLGTITPKAAAAYLVRNQRHARETQTEILLADVPVDAATVRDAFDPHMTAINLPALNDRNYVLLWVAADGAVSMNATYSKTMTQIVNDTTDGLAIAWTARTATRLEGRLTSKGTLKTMDGTTCTVDLKFAVDVPKAAAGDALPAGGGEPGKALTAFLAAVQRKNWPAIKAASSPDALQMFDKSYNTPAENASSVADLVKAWVPATKRTITGGVLRPTEAILDVEGEMFPGTLGVSRVRMIKSGTTWLFDRAARAGFVN